MEVLGAVASGIAVVQALEAVRKTVSLIREIPEIQGDFDGLIKEVYSYSFAWRWELASDSIALVGLNRGHGQGRSADPAQLARAGLFGQGNRAGQRGDD